jgi:hypothetical protein
VGRRLRPAGRRTRKSAAALTRSTSGWSSARAASQQTATAARSLPRAEAPRAKGDGQTWRASAERRAEQETRDNDCESDQKDVLHTTRSRMGRFTTPFGPRRVREAMTATPRRPGWNSLFALVWGVGILLWAIVDWDGHRDSPPLPILHAVAFVSAPTLVVRSIQRIIQDRAESERPG